MKTGNDYAGRIHKPAFIALSVAQFAVAASAVLCRFALRCYQHRQAASRRRAAGPRFGADDALLALGLCCVTVALGLTLRWVDQLYLSLALVAGSPRPLHIPLDVVAQQRFFRIWLIVTQLLLTVAITAVKFSFLIFFRRLVRRLPRLQAAWWAAAAASGVSTVFSLTGPVLTCPWFDLKRSVACAGGKYFKRVIIYASAAIALEIISDVLILFFPVYIVWHIRLTWRKKLALGSSLFLTVFVLAATVVRVAGIANRGIMDAVWNLFWFFVTANVALIVNSATALRVLFVSSRGRGGGKPAGAAALWLRPGAGPVAAAAAAEIGAPGGKWRGALRHGSIGGGGRRLPHADETPADPSTTPADGAATAATAADSVAPWPQPVIDWHQRVSWSRQSDHDTGAAPNLDASYHCATLVAAVPPPRRQRRRWWAMFPRRLAEADNAGEAHGMANAAAPARRYSSWPRSGRDGTADGDEDEQRSMTTWAKRRQR